MIDKMKEITIRLIKEEWTTHDGSPKELDIVKESANLFIRITLTCLFGEGYLEEKVKQRDHGKEVWLPLGEAILK
jgi:hypothetical protein